MSTVIKATLVYWILLLVLRAIPRRTGNMTTPFEFILLFLLGGAAIQPVLGDDHSLTNSVLALCTIALMHLILATLKQRFESFGKVIDGTPVAVLEEGKWYPERMNALRVQAQDVMAAARQQGITALDHLRAAIVERNGSVSVFQQDKPADK